MDGILLLNKPEGVTSTHVVRVVQKRLGGCKVGHLGTLDPAASGLLPLCVGGGTKIAQFLAAEHKGYTGTMKLGAETDTWDATGRIVHTAPVPPLQDKDLLELEKRFVGLQIQLPPLYSAIKKGGVPLYKFARRGVEVEREPRKVRIFALSLRKRASDEVDFELLCSKGTYVRSLAFDLGRALGCGAYLLRLKRVRFGPFTLAQAISVHDLPVPLPAAAPFFLSLRQALSHYPEVFVDSETEERLRKGQQGVLDRLKLEEQGKGVVHLIGPGGDSVALVRKEGRRWRLARVL